MLTFPRTATRDFSLLVYTGHLYLCSALSLTDLLIIVLGSSSSPGTSSIASDEKGLDILCPPSTKLSRKGRIATSTRPPSRKPRNSDWNIIKGQVDKYWDFHDQEITSLA